MQTVLSISSGDHRAAVLARRDALVETHLDLARSIARSVAASLPRTFELEDLTATGFVGLLKAATNYNPRLHGNTPFTAYARPVIRGAILDSVRRGKYIENTRASISDIGEPLDRAPDREGDMDRARLASSVARAVDGLGDRHRNVVEWHYHHEERLPVVGERLSVGKSRASQLHCEAIRELRTQLAEAVV